MPEASTSTSPSWPDGSASAASRWTFSPGRDTPDVPDIVEVHEHTRVITSGQGPRSTSPRKHCLQLIDEFTAQLEARLDDHDLIHSHYWLSGAVGLQIKRSARCYRWCTPCTRWLGSRTPIYGVGQSGRARRTATRRGRHRQRIRRADSQHHRRGGRTRAATTAHDSDQIMIVPPGVDLRTFHPCNQPKSRAQFGVAQDAQVILFVGPHPAAQSAGRVDQGRGRAGAARSRSAVIELQLIIIGGPSGSDSGMVPDTRTAGQLIMVSKDMVDFRPHSARSELFRWYCVSDVVAVPSYNESFGLVALEAQACGRPGGGDRRRRAPAHRS